MKPKPVQDRMGPRRWIFTRRAAAALRRHAVQTYGEDGALAWLEDFGEQVRSSGQEFYLVPGHKIIARAVKVQGRRARELADKPNT